MVNPAETELSIDQAETLEGAPLSFGKRLVAERNLLGVSQAKLSLNAGLSQGYLSQVENDKVMNPSSGTVVGISQALGLGLNFFDGSDDTRTFLRPQAARLEQLLSSPALDKTREGNLRKITITLIPPTEITDNIKYIGPSTKGQKSLGSRIEEAREDLFWTQGLLAEASGVSQGYLSMLESETPPKDQIRPIDPSFPILKKISEALDINLLTLLGLEEKNYSSVVTYLDRFLRSDKYTLAQNQAIFNRYSQVIGMIQPLVNELDPTPQAIYVR